MDLNFLHLHDCQVQKLIEVGRYHALSYMFDELFF